MQKANKVTCSSVGAALNSASKGLGFSSHVKSCNILCSKHLIPYASAYPNSNRQMDYLGHSHHCHAWYTVANHNTFKRCLSNHYMWQCLYSSIRDSISMYMIIFILTTKDIFATIPCDSVHSPYSRPTPSRRKWLFYPYYERYLCNHSLWQHLFPLPPIPILLHGKILTSRDWYTYITWFDTMITWHGLLILLLTITISELFLCWACKSWTPKKILQGHKKEWEGEKSRA